MSPGEDGSEAEDRLVRAAATQLYAGAPAEFIATRTALVKSAKAEGQKEAAKSIGALRRPSVAAWALNQLVHQTDPVIEELAVLGARLRHATSALDASGITELRGPRDAALAALVAAAARVAADDGQKLTAAVEAEVRDTGIAALADEAAEAVLRSGTLTRALSYSGFGEVDVAEAAATTRTGVVLTSIPGGRAGHTGPGDVEDGEAEGTEADGAEAGGAEGVLDEAEDATAEEDDSELDGAQALQDAATELERERTLAEEETAAAQERERGIAEAKAAVHTAEQEVGRRRASVEAARNRTEATRQRIQKLEQQLETARAEDEDALEKLTTAVGNARQADAELKEARERLDRMLEQT